jgi:G:T-mismatch repair DNA endonuclease (very short patch repair protein)
MSKKSSAWDRLTKEERQERIEKSNKKRRQTCLERYGVDNPGKVDIIKDKSRKTCLKKYGVPSATQFSEIKEKKKKTCMERYGVEYALQAKEVKEKKKKTCMERYGVENVFQSQEIKKKIKGKIKIIKEKRKNTCIKKYSVENTFQSEEKKEKIKRTCMERYGVENYQQSLEVKDKMKQICLEKYGTDSFFKTEKFKKKFKQTCLERYGVDHVSKNPEIKLKIKEEIQKKFYKNLLNSDRLKKLVEPLFSEEEYEGTKTNYYKFRCKKCNNIFEDRLINGRIPRCYHCFPISQFTNPHKIICNYLDLQNISYEIEKYINPYFVDIFIEPNKIIEIYGDYWHGNPKFHQITDKIKFKTDNFILVEEKWKQDDKRIKILKNKGNNILILWEDEIKNDFKNIKNKINDFIKMNK